MALQLQFDLVSAVKFSGQTILRLLEACAEDSIQPLVIPPLEAFGSLLLVDVDRIAKGESALKRTQNKVVSMLKLVIGLSDRELTKQVRENIDLTSSFLFAVACAPNLTVEDIGKLIYKMMALKGILNSYRIHSTGLSQFVETVIGYGDMMEEDSPSELYSNLWKTITGRLGNADAFPGLYENSHVDELAKILHNVFEELQNVDNRRITMEGWRTGVWLATVFLWLRPKETDLSFDGYRIFPQIGSTEVRLSINLVRRPDGGDISQWRIHSWHPEENLNKMVEFKDNMIQDPEPHDHYPLEMARAQILNSGINNLVLEETGYLAAALVNVALVEGHLCNKEGSSSLPLQAICSDLFHSAYPTIIEENFGWKNQIINTRQNKIADALRAQVKKVRDRGLLSYDEDLDDVEAIGKEIHECNKHYRDNHGEYLFDDGRLSVAIELAIHLAVQALFF